mgnify:CR=1 FL=1
MSIYYYFFNKNLNEESSYEFWSKITWFAKFNDLVDKDQVTVFKDVVKNNEGWDESHIITAKLDSNDNIIYYKRGEIRRDLRNFLERRNEVGRS